MRAEILSCGTELLLGHITDTNATYLSQSLAPLGIDLYFVNQVGDNQGRIVETLRRAWERSDLIIMTGGLGPTEDDLARELISTLLGETMQVDPSWRRNCAVCFLGAVPRCLSATQAGHIDPFGPGSAQSSRHCARLVGGEG